MTYIIQTKYDCTKTTCGELTKKLSESGGKLDCVISLFVDPTNPTDVQFVNKCWGWIQSRNPGKVLYLLKNKRSTWRHLSLG